MSMLRFFPSLPSPSSSLLLPHPSSVFTPSRVSNAFFSCNHRHFPSSSLPSFSPSLSFISFRHFSLHLRPHFDYSSLLSSLPLYSASLEARRLPSDLSSLRQSLIKYEEMKKEVEEQKEAHRQRSKALALLSPAEREGAIAAERDRRLALSALQTAFQTLERAVEEEVGRLPNLISPATPLGPPSSFRVLSTVEGRGLASPLPPSPPPPFPIRDHLSLGLLHSLFDFQQAAHVSGSRFFFLRNEGALLERALVNWALSFLVKRGFSPLFPPDVVKAEYVYACGFAPREAGEKDRGQGGSANQIYMLEEGKGGEGGDRKALAGTSEVPVAAFFANRVLPHRLLSSPLRLVAFSHCFRQEAGGAGRENKGLYRVHQFSKLEMFSLCAPGDGEGEMEALVALQREMYGALGLSFRSVEIASGDLGAPAWRKVDCEAWMPGRKATANEGGKEGKEGEKGEKRAVASALESGFGEISSASHCLDYQSRRLNIRVDTGKGFYFPHTLNGTAVAAPRLMLAIIEQYQREDGTIEVPEVLREHMMGIDQIPSSLMKNRQFG